MKNKNKILAILMFLLVLFAVAQLMGSVSAANENVIDKGILSYKNNKDIKLNFTAKVYKDTKLEVFRSFSKNDSIYKIKKITFKRINKNKLKVLSVEKYNGNLTKQINM